MGITIRTAHERDLTDVGTLHHRSRTAAYADIVPADALATVSPSSMAAYWVERWKYERDDYQMTVATDADEIVGFTYLGPGVEPGTGMLCAIHVDPAAQGRGIGRALMDDALDKLAAGGWRRVVLWVLAGNTHARRFYERGGWSADGGERDEFIGPALVRQVRYARTIQSTSSP
ncbi:GNAT family N-acetyltransferase [Phytohabitans rumicis]|uniref:N-acetyltransferase n=1 Tax=Phytohabitans rumicis TaxID=1076125 RepID=A0A6V8LA76_9ACTN|nr:GNAT family N-acetyltransferase [Phytohabitans rumicis]GFJ89605.1 N-acetyltransferase [Phytohabitans rumicis]